MNEDGSNLRRDGGMGPWSWFPETVKIWRLPEGKGGILPENWLLSRPSSAIAGEAREVGMGPVNLLPER